MLIDLQMAHKGSVKVKWVSKGQFLFSERNQSSFFFHINILEKISSKRKLIECVCVCVLTFVYICVCVLLFYKLIKRHYFCLILDIHLSYQFCIQPNYKHRRKLEMNNVVKVDYRLFIRHLCCYVI